MISFVNHQEDRLGNLPDEILIKIISCLKTREAVRSGILSMRWKSVWASVPVLELSRNDFMFNGDAEQRVDARFFNFMEQVLIARRLPCLEKVHICGGRKCDTLECDPYLFRSWMRAALVRNANELDVENGEIARKITCELTSNFFSQNKLVILKLHVGMILNFQANSCVFPNLKFLQLHSIGYRDDDSLPNLLSSCPILEDLVIYRGKDNLETLNLISRSLKRVKLITNDKLVDYYESKMVIDAPALESLYSDFIGTNEFLVKDLSHIVEADFEVVELHSSCYKLLRGVSNVRFLTLACYIEEETIERPNAYNFPMFYNLNRLEISSESSCHHGELTKFFLWKFLLQILQCSPLLENLIYLVYQDVEDGEIPQEDGQASDWNVPSCLVSSLKTIEFEYIQECDVERVRYFLRNAQVLENMTIRYGTELISEELKSKLCNAIFEGKKNGSVAVTWSEEEIVISFR